MDRFKRLESNLRALDYRLSQLHNASQKLTWWRVSTFFIGLILTALGLEFGGVIGALVSFFISLAVFMGLVQQHRKIKTHLFQFKVWREFKSLDIKRFQRDWESLPLHHSQAPKGHPFAIDLDIVGEGSLLQLMDTTFSENGHARLKTWLLDTSPELETTFRRQGVVKELLPLVRFRQGIALCLKESAQYFRQAVPPEDKWKSQEVLDFIERFEVQPQFETLLKTLSLLALCNWGFYLSAQFLGTPSWLWKASLTVYVILFMQNKDHISGLFKESSQLSYHLFKLKGLFDFFAAQPCDNRPQLSALLAPFKTGDAKPTQLLKSLQRIVGAGGVQGNPMAWVVLNVILPWDFIFAYQLNKIKPQLKTEMPRWLDRVYELEALSALAHYAWLHPQQRFPLLAPEGLPLIAKGVGHPLLPQKVTNNFQIKRLEEAFIITGSNMAGKSTFLKSLGLNLILAYAGTVVDAESFEARPMRLFSCIKVSDSVQDGLSYFYAEVRRLKALLEALETPHELPLFFLIDEIFKGTNNRERLLGSQAYIQALTHKFGVGGISTHDLELVNLARENPRLSNFHFREDIIEGKMHFDYTIRPGPCPTTNALKIMALEGLPIEVGTITKAESFESLYQEDALPESDSSKGEILSEPTEPKMPLEVPDPKDNTPLEKHIIPNELAALLEDSSEQTPLDESEHLI